MNELEKLEQAVKDAMVMYNVEDITAAVRRGIIDVSSHEVRNHMLEEARRG